MPVFCIQCQKGTVVLGKGYQGTSSPRMESPMGPEEQGLSIIIMDPACL